ncbi:MAG: tetratricopeptide repeat protein [Planctomycetes bacterium]|nr:tetratricopeptide repeat protein [Planctomycetota bacterium]
MSDTRTGFPGVGISSPWIARPGWDLSLVLLTPLLALPLLLIWRERRGDFAVHEAVMAFGALGHHFPGMLRAYGDRALFARFRTRFLLAPLFLALVCAGFQLAGLHGLAVIALGWGIWHGWMQTFGFARIYDAKRRSYARTTARIDFALCAAWFLAPVVLSSQRSLQVLEALAASGLPLPSAAAIDALRSGAWFALASTALLYVAWSWRETRAGRAPSALKHVLLVSTFALWWISTNLVPSLIFGLALFEICHDVQYLAIVWAFNRRRAESAPACGPVTRFLFRGGALGAGLYLGLVLGYGALGPLAKQVGDAEMRQALAGLVLASQLLHFYFDGFLWKVREAPTREALGVSGDGSGARSERRGAKHLALWTLFALPVVGLGARELALERSAADAAAIVAASLPEDAEAQTRAGLAHARAGRPEEALPALRRAHALEPGANFRRSDLARTLGEAADAQLTRRDTSAARATLEEARALEPQFEALLELLAHARASSGEIDAASRSLAALDLLRPDPRWRLARASLLANAGRLGEALQEVRRVRASDPSHLGAIELERQLQARAAGR